MGHTQEPRDVAVRKVCVDANLGQHTNALDRAREKEIDAALPAWSGQTGLRDRSDRSPVRIGDGRRTRTREGPVRVGARRVVLGSAGHLKCLQTSRRRRKNNRWGLEELGFEDKSKGNKR